MFLPSRWLAYHLLTSASRGIHARASRDERRIGALERCPAALLSPLWIPWWFSVALRNIPPTGERDCMDGGLQQVLTRVPGAIDANDRSDSARHGRPAPCHEASSATLAGRIDRAPAADRAGSACRKQAAHSHQGARRLRQDFAGARVAQPAARERRTCCLALDRYGRRRTRPLTPPPRTRIASRLQQRPRLRDRPNGPGLARSLAEHRGDADQRAGGSR